MCLRKVVRLSFAQRHVLVSLTGVGAATGGFGAKPGTCEGTTKENRECVEGTAPRRLDSPGSCIPDVRGRVRIVKGVSVSDLLCRHLPLPSHPCTVIKSLPKFEASSSG